MASLFRYVALGDSSGVGVGSGNDGGYPERLYKRLKAHGVPAGILNLAQSGAQSRDVLRLHVQRAAEKQPALVTVGIGANDLWRLVSAEEFSDNLQAIAEVLQRSGARVVVSNLVDLGRAPAAKVAQSWLGITPQMITERVLLFNARIAKLGERPGFEVVDLFGPSHAELSGPTGYFSGDGFHPSAHGYDRWAELAWPAVQRASGLPLPAPAGRGSG
ncbi:MAG: SGNH/GDSL hydrolase family protein [Archangium sp.]|nr:SGNH/GDSL hydrolase family protein [Archangium sp.]